MVSIIEQTETAFLNLALQVQTWWILFLFQLTSSWWRPFHLKQTLASLYLPRQDCFRFHMHCYLCLTWPGTCREFVVYISPADPCVCLSLSGASFNYCYSWNRLFILYKTVKLIFLTELFTKRLEENWDRVMVFFLKSQLKSVQENGRHLGPIWVW